MDQPGIGTEMLHLGFIVRNSSITRCGEVSYKDSLSIDPDAGHPLLIPVIEVCVRILDHDQSDIEMISSWPSDAIVRMCTGSYFRVRCL